MFVSLSLTAAVSSFCRSALEPQARLAAIQSATPNPDYPNRQEEIAERVTRRLDRLTVRAPRETLWGLVALDLFAKVVEVAAILTLTRGVSRHSMSIKSADYLAMTSLALQILGTFHEFAYEVHTDRPYRGGVVENPMPNYLNVRARNQWLFFASRCLTCSAWAITQINAANNHLPSLATATHSFRLLVNVSIVVNMISKIFEFFRMTIDVEFPYHRISERLGLADRVLSLFGGGDAHEDLPALSLAPENIQGPFLNIPAYHLPETHSVVRVQNAEHQVEKITALQLGEGRITLYHSRRTDPNRWYIRFRGPFPKELEERLSVNSPFFQRDEQVCVLIGDSHQEYFCRNANFDADLRVLITEALQRQGPMIKGARQGR